MKPTNRERERRRKAKLQRRADRTYRPGKGTWLWRLSRGGVPLKRAERAWVPRWKTLRRMPEARIRAENELIRQRVRAAAVSQMTREERREDEWKRGEAVRKVWQTRRANGQFTLMEIPKQSAKRSRNVREEQAREARRLAA